MGTGEDGVARDAHAEAETSTRGVIYHKPLVGGELRLLRVIPRAVVGGDAGDQESES